MDLVSVEAAEALSGEEAFILQLRPPAPPGADEAALAERIDQFTAMFLKAAGPGGARFAPVGPLTWAIAASRFDGAEIEALRADLCETLFAVDDPEHVQLARQPSAPQATNCADHPSAASRAAFDDESDTFDLDSSEIDIGGDEAVDVDDWTLPEPSSAPDESPDSSGFEAPDEGDDFDIDPFETDALDADAFDAPDEDAPDAQAQNADPFDAEDDDPYGVDGPALERSAGSILDALNELERAVAEDEPPALADAGFDAETFEADLDAFETFMSAGAPAELEPAEPEDAAAAEIDDTPVAETEPGDEIEDTPFAETEPADEVDEADDAVPADDEDAFETLTEAPSPRHPDIAAELAAFRREMREIAGAIPAAGAGEALSRFREEIDAVAGSLGQRVDGAAQRIEAAADRILSASPDSAERMNGAAERAERSAALMETSVRETVEALKAALAAANAAPPDAHTAEG